MIRCKSNASPQRPDEARNIVLLLPFVSPGPLWLHAPQRYASAIRLKLSLCRRTPGGQPPNLFHAVRNGARVTGAFSLSLASACGAPGGGPGFAGGMGWASTAGCIGAAAGPGAAGAGTCTAGAGPAGLGIGGTAAFGGAGITLGSTFGLAGASASVWVAASRMVLRLPRAGLIAHSAVARSAQAVTQQASSH